MSTDSASGVTYGEQRGWHDAHCAGRQAGFAKLCTCREIDELRESGDLSTPVQPSALASSKPGSKPRTCWNCCNSFTGDSGTYCKVFGEVVLSEVTAAQDCEVFDCDDV
jgi:hypothetical protein